MLIRQFGGVPYTDNDTKVTYNNEAGLKALTFYTDLQKKHKVGQSGFMDEGQAAFRAGLAAMTIDGTFRLGSFGTIKAFEWGVAELPANAQGMRSNYASYLANAITSKAEGEKLDAAEKFLTYVSSPEAMKIWLEVVGELPARRTAALTPENAAHPVYGPFLKGLEYAQTTLVQGRSRPAPGRHRHGQPRPDRRPGARRRRSPRRPRPSRRSSTAPSAESTPRGASACPLSHIGRPPQAASGRG